MCVGILHGASLIIETHELAEGDAIILLVGGTPSACSRTPCCST